ncbi:MAG: ATP-binding protein [Leeuwenhoekiella sp.]
MKNQQSPITIKIILGYLTLIGILVFALYSIYPQLRKLIYPKTSTGITEQKLGYVSNALSYLYEAETTGRSAMTTGSETQLDNYQSYTDSLVFQLDSLRLLVGNPSQKKQLDSIKSLLDLKNDNLQNMVALRRQQTGRSFYDEAIAALIQEDIYFEDYENDPSLDTVDPYVKKVLVDWAKYIRMDNADPDADRTALAQTVREVLAKVERRKDQLQAAILSREKNLLQTDRILTQNIRQLLSGLDREALLLNRTRQRELNKQVDEISDTLLIFGLLSIVLVIAFITTIARDNARNKQYSDALEASRNRAEKLLQSRENLMNTINHDIRAPLNTISGFTRLLKESRLDAHQKELTQQISKASGYMNTLVQGLLEYSKIESGNYKLIKSDFHPKQLIDDVLMMVLPEPLKSGLQVKVNVAKNAEKHLKSDVTKLKQILGNLITNAYNHTEAGCILVSASVASSNPLTLRFSVSDTGPGIPKAEQKQIFQAFQQAKSSLKKENGFGLGLAIVKKLTEALKGKIDLESREGEGSTFILILPVEIGAKPNEILISNNDNGTENLSITYSNILLVDDDPSQLMLAESLIKKTGTATIRKTSATEALKYLNETNELPDLILTDIQMPEMSGVQFLKALQANARLGLIPVVAISGNTIYSSDDYKKMGFKSSLSKPYTPHDFRKLLSIPFPVVEPFGEKDKGDGESELFSLETIHQFTDNDPEALRHILEVFIKNSEENLGQLQIAFAENDREAIQQISHKVLPMLRQLQAKKLIVLLEPLEKKEDSLSRSENLQTIKSEFKELLAALKAKG